MNARSREIVAAAHIVTLSWCFTFFWFHFFSGTGITWGYAVIDAAVAAVFWRQSRRSIFALPLFFNHALCVLLYLIATVLQLAEWWVFFVVNRLFELEIAYLIACSLFRIRRLALDNNLTNKKGRASGAP